MGPSSPYGTVLTLVKEAVVVKFRRRTLLLDDVLGCLRDSISRLTRSSLHQCLERHGISRLPLPAFHQLRLTEPLLAPPENPDKGAKRVGFAATAIGAVHIDISAERS